MSPLGNELLPELHPYAFVTLPKATLYTQRSYEAEPEVLQMLSGFINATTAVLERETGRRLAARSYRTQTTMPFALAADDETLTGPTTTLRERDELAHVSIRPGTLVDSITDSTHAEMTKQAISANGAATVTVGFGPLVIDGRSCDRTRECYQFFYVPETPVVALHAVSYRNSAGTLTAVDITGARIDAGTGYVVLPVGYLPDGSQNIVIECTAGYLPPRAGRVSGFGEWQDVELLQHRMVKIMWSDYIKGTGRVANIQFGEVNEFVNTYRWPADIEEGFAAHRRIG